MTCGACCLKLLNILTPSVTNYERQKWRQQAFVPQQVGGMSRLIETDTVQGRDRGTREGKGGKGGQAQTVREGEAEEHAREGGRGRRHILSTRSGSATRAPARDLPITAAQTS